MNLGMPWNRLRNLRGGIVIPVVFSAMPNQHAPGGFDLPDKVFAFHRSVNSASLRTPGMCPLVRS